DFLPWIDTVAIQSDAGRGSSIAAAFLKRDKEVIWVVSSDRVAREFLDSDAGGKMAAAVQEKRLRLVAGNPITEILGEGDAKAVRLKSGKVLAAQIVIFPDAQADLKLFIDPAVTIEGGIRVNEQFQTGIEGVLALDAACRPVPRGGTCSAGEAGANPGQENTGFLLVTVLEQQGAAVAAALKGPKMADSNAS
ncbi:MAG: FAD-dependent oxidoreductase, partial [Candidatus Omnitrophica bacterium]|nr:FAD-dependent oxidoreductase [Candidatus Omnitrophota bacterium]